MDEIKTKYTNKNCNLAKIQPKYKHKIKNKQNGLQTK